MTISANLQSGTPVSRATKSSAGGKKPDGACWNCGAETRAAHFCPACGRIQPLAADADYFAFFGLPRKLQLDSAELERQFLLLSWKLHPDNFVRASDCERELSLDRSSRLNDASRILQNPLSRVEYLLEREGVRREGAAKQQAPPELLAEVFELNESLDEMRSVRADNLADGEEAAALRDRLVEAQGDFQEKLAEIDAELSAASGDWDAALEFESGNGSNAAAPARRAELLARLNEILNRRSYVRNLVNTVQGELEQSELEQR
jgi:molecular chaperone HscB